VSVFDHLPAAVRVLVPELDNWTGEPRADCAHCPMAAMGPGVPPEWSFADELRCCTAHPNLANFLVGRAIARGNPGRGRIAARLADPDGVSARGVWWPAAYEKRYRERIESGGYGNDPSLRCPYHLGGEHGCSIWQDRNAMCRSWYCKHERGHDGGIAWHRADVLVTTIEERLADLLVLRGKPPTAPASADRWAAWFVWCAEDVERLTPEQIAVILPKDVREHRAELVQLRRRGGAPMPDVVVAAITDIVTVGDEVLVSGYSSFDAVRAPRALFSLIAKLDGRATWRAALAAARAELREPGWLDEALVRELYRVGAVRGDDDTAS
jgi:hypothetical protein